MTVPTRGLCHSVFLLTYSAHAKPKMSVMDWVAAARRSPTFMANALAIESAASLLFDFGLAVLDERGIQVDRKLLDAGDEASTETLATIASILLKVNPPPWFQNAVRRGVVEPELIPTVDEDALAWLEEFRDPILLELTNKNQSGDEFRSWLGNIGEQLVVESEKELGRKVVHVSKISDSFGFDIESWHGTDLKCIEVKTVLDLNSDHFFISKNEAMQAQKRLDSWWLVQVVLDQTAVTAQMVKREHFLSAHCISAKDLMELLPLDTKTGMWMETARIAPREDSWSAWKTQVPQSWRQPGYRSDAK